MELPRVCQGQMRPAASGAHEQKGATGRGNAATNASSASSSTSTTQTTRKDLSYLATYFSDARQLDTPDMDKETMVKTLRIPINAYEEHGPVHPSVKEAVAIIQQYLQQDHTLSGKRTSDTF